MFFIRQKNITIGIAHCRQIMTNYIKGKSFNLFLQKKIINDLAFGTMQCLSILMKEINSNTINCFPLFGAVFLNLYHTKDLTVIYFSLST